MNETKEKERAEPEGQPPGPVEPVTISKECEEQDSGAEDGPPPKRRYLVIALVFLSVAVLVAAVFASKLRPASITDKLRKAYGALLESQDDDYVDAIEPAELILARQKLLEQNKAGGTGTGLAGGEPDKPNASQLVSEMKKITSAVRTSYNVRSAIVKVAIVLLVIIIVSVCILYRQAILSLFGRSSNDALVKNQ